MESSLRAKHTFRIVGAFTLAAAALLGVAVLPWDDLLGLTYTVRIYVPEASGIGKHTKVRIHGFEVGTVEAVRLAPPSIAATPGSNRKIEIALRLEKEIQEEVRTDSTASFQVAGLFDDRHIAIERGLTGTPIADGGEIPFKPDKQVDLRALVEALAKIVTCPAEEAAGKKNRKAKTEVPECRNANK